MATLSGQQYRQNNNLFLKNIENPPEPYLNFDLPGFPAFIPDTIKYLGFKSFTPIQAQALPIIMTGRDFIGISKTGSGKTLTYLIPAIAHMVKNPSSSRTTTVLVLAPTRQLAVQIQNEFKKFLFKSSITWACVFGGVKKDFQRPLVSRGVQILVATPGRLIDFIEEGTVNIENVTYFVLDEADRMLDLGFAPQIRQICSYMRQQKQSLMFSATWPFEIKKLADRYLHDAVLLQIGVLQRSINDSITQQTKIVAQRDKLNQLLNDLRRTRERRLVFVQKKIDCQILGNKLYDEGERCATIHGDKAQAQRDRSLQLFKTGKIKILVATDVASRGLDIPDVELVINYDFPKQIEDYIHRIGRTGRAGKSGLTISYLTDGEDNRLGDDLIKVLKESKQQISSDLIAFSRRKGGSSKFDNYQRNRYNQQNNPLKKNIFAYNLTNSQPNSIGPVGSSGMGGGGFDSWRKPQVQQQQQGYSRGYQGQGNYNRLDNKPSYKSDRDPRDTRDMRDRPMPPKTRKILSNLTDFQKIMYFFLRLLDDKLYHPCLSFDCNEVTINIKLYDTWRVQADAMVVGYLPNDRDHNTTRRLGRCFGVYPDFVKGVSMGNLKIVESKKVKHLDHIIMFNLPDEEEDKECAYLSTILKKVLKQAEKEKYESIMLHELGMGKYPQDLEAKTVLYTLCELLSNCGQELDELCSITIAIQNDKEYLEYAKLYHEMIENAKRNKILTIEA